LAGQGKNAESSDHRTRNLVDRFEGSRVDLMAQPVGDAGEGQPPQCRSHVNTCDHPANPVYSGFGND
jgi:hypothetical protein